MDGGVGGILFREVILLSKKDKEPLGAGLPEGFREALNKNAKALEYWAAMTPRERQVRTQAVSRLTKPEEIEAYVNDLVGWEMGHPPYQC